MNTATTNAARDHGRVCSGKLGPSDLRMARELNRMARLHIREANLTRARRSTTSVTAADPEAQQIDQRTPWEAIAAAVAAQAAPDEPDTRRGRPARRRRNRRNGSAAGRAARSAAAAATQPQTTPSADIAVDANGSTEAPAPPAAEARRRRRARGGRRHRRNRGASTPLAPLAPTAPAAPAAVLLAWLLATAAQRPPATHTQPHTPASTTEQTRATDRRHGRPKTHLPFADLHAAAQTIIDVHGRARAIADGIACLNPSEQQELRDLAAANAAVASTRRLRQMTAWRLAAAQRQSPRASERLGAAIAVHCIALATPAELQIALDAHPQ